MSHETEAKRPDGDREDCCAVVVHYRTPELAIRCVEQLGSSAPGIAVLLVDSGSGDGRHGDSFVRSIDRHSEIVEDAPLAKAARR